MSSLNSFQSLAHRPRRWLRDKLPPASLILEVGWAIVRGRLKPLNGQEGRENILVDIITTLKPQAVIETGTHIGMSTRWFRWHFRGPIYSIELQRAYRAVAGLTLFGLNDIHLLSGDSSQVLRLLAADARVPKRSVLFYLDAHWYGRSPLAAELSVISDHWSDSVVVIDDFEVPGDPGYGFGDNGSTQGLTLDAVPALDSHQLFWPSMPSARETGYKRGTAVVAFGRSAESLKLVDSLRPN